MAAILTARAFNRLPVTLTVRPDTTDGRPVVRLSFGVHVAEIGLTVAEALALADALTTEADQADARAHLAREVARVRGRRRAH